MKNNREGVRKVLLKGIFWRILIIESILLVWSLLYRALSDHHAQPVDLFWYAVRITLLVAIIILFVMVTFRKFLNKKIILPLEEISASNRRLKESDSSETHVEVADDAPIEIREIVATRQEMLTTIFKVSEERLRLVNFVRDMFGRYLSKKVVDNILESPEGHKIGGRRKTVTILMSDIRGFTGLSETMDPEIMVQLLNRYLERMSKIILQYDGIIDEILGDSILAVFGVPEKHETDPARAVACAVAMQNALDDLNNEFIREGHPPLEMGIGINTGSVVVGNIGSEVRMKYAVVGSAVNTAARIESNTVGGQILLGESTYDLVKETVTCGAPQAFMMKGIKKPLVVYAVKRIGSPYNLELQLRETLETGVYMNLPFRCWTVEHKKIGDSAVSGETVMLSENLITASIAPGLDPLTDIKLVFDFCVEAHCFEDIYAKVLSVKEKEGTSVHQLQITSIDPKDRDILDQWMKDAS
ncbi:MAG: adenylate/guanylate cyclase domain-containing protein [Desulfobacteraceae bacterium]|nr:adenylate/guanylate cyclase domain-containing protein [Desulfobacteraceae bacterium]